MSFILLNLDKIIGGTPRRLRGLAGPPDRERSAWLVYLAFSFCFPRPLRPHSGRRPHFSRRRRIEGPGAKPSSTRESQGRLGGLHTVVGASPSASTHRGRCWNNRRPPKLAWTWAPPLSVLQLSEPALSRSGGGGYLRSRSRPLGLQPALSPH